MAAAASMKGQVRAHVSFGTESVVVELGNIAQLDSWDASVMPMDYFQAVVEEKIGTGRLTSVRVTYSDDEGDWCLLMTSADLKEAASLAISDGTGTITVSVLGRRFASKLSASSVTATTPTKVAATAPAAPTPEALAAAVAAAATVDVASVIDTAVSSVSSWDNTLTFMVNGKTVTVENPDPKLLLVDYLRDVAMLRGTKIGCGEGGCGACTVTITYLSPDGTPVTAPVNSCLRLLCSMDGMAVTTVEGIGSKKAGYHPTQERLASCNGSQCGFCSVGQVMNMYGLLKQQPTLSQAEIENTFDGNLCRCTGYRPIMKAMKTFATSTDEVKIAKRSDILEPLAEVGAGAGSGSGSSSDSDETKADSKCENHTAAGVCERTGLACSGDCHRNEDRDMEDLFAPYVPEKHDPATPDLATIPLRPLVFRGGKYKGTSVTAPVWFRPVTLAQLLSLQRSVAALPAGTVKLVVGNTAMGVSKYYQATPYDYSVYIDVSQVAEFRATHVDSSGITAGAAVTIRDLIFLCNQADPTAPTTTNDPKNDDNAVTATSTFAALSRDLCRVANHQVRSAASWTGNLMLAAHHPNFPSDLVLALATVGATVTIVRGGTVTPGVTPLEILKTCNEDVVDTIIVSLSVPAQYGKGAGPSPSSTAYTAVDTFKVAQRHQNSHSLVNAGFRCSMTASSGTATPVIADAFAVFGGVGKVIFEAVNFEAAIKGQSWSTALVQTALTALTKDIDAVGDSTAYSTSPAYRRQLAASYVYKFALRCQPSLAANLQSAATRYLRPVSSGTEVFTPTTTGPIHEAHVKLTALLQTSGEAIYTFDVKAPADALHGVFAFTTVPLGTLDTLDTTAAAACPGVESIITAADIIGKNDCGINPGEEMLFVPIGGAVTTIGQPLCLILADTAAHAQFAAAQVQSTYQAPAGGAKPVITLQEAIASNNSYPASGIIAQLARGNAAGAMSRATHTAKGNLLTPSQQHFYMETQNAIATPLEDELLDVIASTQALDLTQSVIQNVTSYPANKVNVGIRRAGGAFGGKISRGLHVAAAAALAAVVVNRPVHVRLDRTDDIRTVAGRETLLGSYEVGYSDTGVITALEVSMWSDAGHIVDTSYGDMDMAQLWADNCYYIANYTSNALCMKTNKPTTTSTRAPGVVQSVVIMETVMERVAVELGMDPLAVRQANYYHIGNTTPYGQTIKYMSLPKVLTNLQSDAQYTATVAAVKAFNSANRWRKRGVAITPIKYGIGDPGYNTSTMIRIFQEDGTVVVTTGGVESGQGLFTKVGQVVAGTLGVPLSMVRVTATDTNRIPRNTVTGGSGTSETCCASALDAANIINTRLAPLKAAMPKATWPQLIAAAAGQEINLSSQGWYNPAPPSTLANNFTYFVWAAAQSVVEIDVLTGQLEILSSWIYYDCGESLNPDVDIGQIEGAFMMGLGYYFTEQVAHDATTGALTSTGTWNYKPPFPLDIPQTFNVTLLKDAPNPTGILRSKATGEPPLSLANSAYFATKNAISAARADAGLTGWFDLGIPASPDQIQQATGTDPTQFTV